MTASIATGFDISTANPLTRGLACGLAATLLSAGCSSGPNEDCPPPNTYTVYVQTQSEVGQSCQVTFAGTNQSTTYTFAPVGDCNTRTDSPSCAPLNGAPSPSSCEVLGCDLQLQFGGQAGLDLVHYLGAQTFSMTASCNGTVVDTESIAPVTTCAL